MTAKIVLLNGVGSVGKTSIAKALQRITAEPYLHVQMDAFLEMLPEALQESLPGFAFTTIWEDGRPPVAIEAGPVGRRVMQGMRDAVAAMASRGSNLIVDDVMIGSEMAQYQALLCDFHLSSVGVFAPLDVLEARESERADRLPGLARWQFGRMHSDVAYDLEVDTSVRTAQECALRIQQRFQL